MVLEILVTKDSFPKLKDVALKMYSMYGRVYLCKSTFSTIKQIKSKTEVKWKTKH